MKWTSIAPIPESLWLINHSMPLSFPNGVHIDWFHDKYRFIYPRDELVCCLRDSLSKSLYLRQD